MPHASHELDVLGVTTEITRGIIVYVPQGLPISNSNQEVQQSPTTNAATTIAQMGRSMVTRSRPHRLALQSLTQNISRRTMHTLLVPSQLSLRLSSPLLDNQVC